MPISEGTYMGLALPVHGGFINYGDTTANDQVTWQQRGGASGDFMVWRTSAGTELALIDASGSMIFKDSVALEFGSLAAAAGDMVLQFDGTSLILSASTAGTRFDVGGTTTATAVDMRLISNSQNGVGDYVQWDASSARLFLRQSGGGALGQIAHLNLTGGVNSPISTTPTTGLAPGDIFIVNGLGVTTCRLGYCNSGNAVRYGKLFDLGITSTT